jgi:hypothetical protein
VVAVVAIADVEVKHSPKIPKTAADNVYFIENELFKRLLLYNDVMFSETAVLTARQTGLSALCITTSTLLV